MSAEPVKTVIDKEELEFEKLKQTLNSNKSYSSSYMSLKDHLRVIELSYKRGDIAVTSDFIVRASSIARIASKMNVPDKAKKLDDLKRLAMDIFKKYPKYFESQSATTLTCEELNSMIKFICHVCSRLAHMNEFGKILKLLRVNVASALNSCSNGSEIATLVRNLLRLIDEGLIKSNHKKGESMECKHISSFADDLEGVKQAIITGNLIEAIELFHLAILEKDALSLDEKGSLHTLGMLIMSTLNLQDYIEKASHKLMELYSFIKFMVQNVSLPLTNQNKFDGLCQDLFGFIEKYMRSDHTSSKMFKYLTKIKDTLQSHLKNGEVEEEEQEDYDINLHSSDNSENKEDINQNDCLTALNEAISNELIPKAIKIFNKNINNGSNRMALLQVGLNIVILCIRDLSKYCMSDGDRELNELSKFIDNMIKYGDELVHQQREMSEVLGGLEQCVKKLIVTNAIKPDSAAFVQLCAIVTQLSRFSFGGKFNKLNQFQSKYGMKKDDMMKGEKSGMNKNKVIHNRNYLNVLNDSIQKGSIETAVELFNHPVAVDSLELLKYGLKILNVLDVEQYYFSKDDPYLNELQKFVDYMIKHTGGSEVDCQKDIFESLMLVKDSITNFMATNQIETEGKRFGVLCVMIGKLNQYELTLKIFDNRVMADADKGDIKDQKYHNKENLFRLSNAMNSEINGKSLANTRYKRPFGALEKEQSNMGINPSSFNHGSGNDDMSQSGTGVPPLAKKSRSMNGSKRASNEVGNNVHQGGNNDATISTLDKMQIQRNEPNRNELADRSQMDHAGVSIQNNNIGGTNLTTQNFGNNGHRYETQLQTTANHPINSYHIVSIKRLDVATNRWQQISGENKCGWNNNNMSRRSTIYTSNIIRYLHNDTYQFNVKTYQELKTIADKDEFVRTIMARHYGFHQS